MIKGYLFALVLFASAFGMEGIAQSKKVKAVSQTVEALRQAMIDANGTTLSRLTHDKLSYGHSGGRVEDKAAFISALLSGQSDFVTIELTGQSIEVVNKTAIVRHTLSASTNDSGKPGTVKLAVLTIWQKGRGQWKLLSRQSVRI
jgi:ketosteroid isomerase-like protein